MFQDDNVSKNKNYQQISRPQKMKPIIFLQSYINKK